MSTADTRCCRSRSAPCRSKGPRRSRRTSDAARRIRPGTTPPCRTSQRDKHGRTARSAAPTCGCPRIARSSQSAPEGTRGHRHPHPRCHRMPQRCSPSRTPAASIPVVASLLPSSTALRRHASPHPGRRTLLPFPNARRADNIVIMLTVAQVAGLRPRIGASADPEARGAL